MSQATRRCVECSQPMVEEGLLCPACQRRTGRTNAPATNPPSPESGPLYATALAPQPVNVAPLVSPPLYNAPPAQAMDLTGGHSGSNLDIVSHSTYAPPPGAATATAATGSTPQSVQKVYPAAPVASQAPSRAAADPAEQKANVELAALTLKQYQSSTPQDTPWFVSFVQAVGARLMVRLVIALIIGLAAFVGGFQRHRRAVSNYDIETSNGADSAPAMMRTAAPQPLRVPVNQMNSADRYYSSLVDRQAISRANRAYEDAQRALNQMAGAGNRDDMERLMAQVNADVQIMRETAARASLTPALRINQAAIELENRVQALQAQSQTPMMPAASGSGENAGMGIPQQMGTPSKPVEQAGGSPAPVEGQPAAPSGTADAPPSGDPNGQASGLPGRPGGGN